MENPIFAVVGIVFALLCFVAGINGLRKGQLTIEFNHRETVTLTGVRAFIVSLVWIVLGLILGAIGISLGQRDAQSPFPANTALMGFFAIFGTVIVNSLCAVWEKRILTDASDNTEGY